VEDTSAFGPVSVKVARLEEAIALFEKEVVGYELVFLRFTHRAQRVKSSSELSSEATAGLNDLLFYGVSLLPSDLGTEREFG